MEKTLKFRNCKCTNHVEYLCGCLAKRGLLLLCDYHYPLMVAGRVEDNSWLLIAFIIAKGLKRRHEFGYSPLLIRGKMEGYIGFRHDKNM